LAAAAEADIEDEQSGIHEVYFFLLPDRLQPPMRIATWNVNSIRARLPHLLNWLADAQVDVLAVQETKVIDADFPYDPLRAAGWHAVHNGQKTYNGVAILAREEPTDVSRDMPAFEDAQKRVIAATVGGVRIVNVYVVNGQAVGSEKFEYKMRWLDALGDHIVDQLAGHSRLIVTGDFNIAPTPEDTHDPAIWEGHLHCSEAEREKFRALLALGLTDCLAARPPESGQRFTWWDYRQGAFRRNRGLRIDHVLASAELAGRLARCEIDLGPRRLERASDHAPVVTQFTL
jgi:exodeoxyribonuclease-3